MDFIYRYLLSYIVAFFNNINNELKLFILGLIGFLSTFIFGTLISLVVSQVSKSSENGSADSTQDVDPDKPRSMGNVTVDPYLLHPIVNTLLCGCYNGDSRHEEEPKDYNGTM